MAAADVQVIHTDFGPHVDEHYIGDGVYASHDTLQIWLHAESVHGAQEIALDRATFTALVEYAKRIGLA